jgi:polyhydroxyalkanoate synthesis regulator phasin
MDPKQIAKQMIAFNKTAFDNNFNAINTLHEQTEKIVSKFWEKSPMFPEEGKKAISEWMKAYKKGCEDFKNAVDENFKKVEDFFNENK